jgi:hypothetical protein
MAHQTKDKLLIWMAILKEFKAGRRKEDNNNNNRSCFKAYRVQDYNAYLSTCFWVDRSIKRTGMLLHLFWANWCYPWIGKGICSFKAYSYTNL